MHGAKSCDTDARPTMARLLVDPPSRLRPTPTLYQTGMCLLKSHEEDATRVVKSLQIIHFSFALESLLLSIRTIIYAAPLSRNISLLCKLEQSAPSSCVHAEAFPHSLLSFTSNPATHSFASRSRNLGQGPLLVLATPDPGVGDSSRRTGRRRA